MTKINNPIIREKAYLAEIDEITNFILAKKELIINGDRVDLITLKHQVQMLTDTIKKNPPKNLEVVSIAIERLITSLSDLEIIVRKKMNV